MSAVRRRNGRTARGILLTVAVLSLLAAFLYLKISAEYVLPAERDRLLRVCFIDVGQADSELIVCGDHSVLIDGGDAAAGPKLVWFLRRLGIDRLDCVVATHPHADHIGGLPDVLDRVKVGQVIMPALTESAVPTTRVYERFLESVAGNGAQVVPAVPGAVHAFGDIVMTILSPVFGETESLNDMSVVLRLQYKNVSFLFTGDAGEAVENELLANGSELSADVLKVAHHGSETSSSPEFIRAVSPRVAVVECGDGTAHHPHRDTVAALTAGNAAVFRTDRDGTVTVLTDGDRLSVEKEK